MKVDIRDRGALLAVSPSALSAYARTAGWSLHESYREHSDIYVGEALPEIIVPRTERLGDYASVVATLIKTFARVAERDELSLYRDLATCDRDVIRARVADGEDGSLSVNEGTELIGGARDMLLAAACSLDMPRPVYRAGANRDAANLMQQVRLGQTEQSSFVVTLLTPVVPSRVQMELIPDMDDQNAPIARRMTRRLLEALAAVRQAMERTVAGDESAFEKDVDKGVSANLCEALVRLIEPFPALDVYISWALTRPLSRLLPMPANVRFGQSDAALLREAARMFRDRSPQPDVRLHGFVRLLKRDKGDEDGTIRLTTEINRRKLTVEALLEQADYERAVQAHGDRALVVLTGDLECMRQRWRLLNPSLETVLRDDEYEAEND